jgi:hypothetical protein
MAAEQRSACDEAQSIGNRWYNLHVHAKRCQLQKIHAAIDNIGLEAAYISLNWLPELRKAAGKWRYLTMETIPVIEIYNLLSDG